MPLAVAGDRGSETRAQQVREGEGEPEGVEVSQNDEERTFDEGENGKVEGSNTEKKRRGGKRKGGFAAATTMLERPSSER